MRTYTELSDISSLAERFEYLKLCDIVGNPTFDAKRYLNQKFYRSPEWKKVRDAVIIRDLGNELGLYGYPISGRIYVHHMNPITIEDVLERNDKIFDPEFLISVSFDMHEAIHYGDLNFIRNYMFIERRPGDTCPWKDAYHG